MPGRGETMAVKINYDYLARIRSMVGIFTGRRTSNILDGSFRSVFTGKSMEFDDLKEYAPGDDVHDIDWKSSSRTGKVLIRRYEANRRHNLLFVMDTERGMTGDTDARERKPDIELVTFGTVAYLAGRQGADFAYAYGGKGGFRMSLFRSGIDVIGEGIREILAAIGEEGAMPADEVLRRVTELTRRRMIVVLITDLGGLEKLSEATVRRVTQSSDLLVFLIRDAAFAGANVYDVDGSRYGDEFVLDSRRLRAEEKALRKGILDRAGALFKTYGVTMTSISRESEIIDRTVDLFERHRNEVYR